MWSGRVRWDRVTGRTGEGVAGIERRRTVIGRRGEAGASEALLFDEESVGAGWELGKYEGTFSVGRYLLGLAFSGIEES